MDFKFTTDIPAGYTKMIPVISGADSILFNGYEYVVLQSDTDTITVFEIRYEYHCSSFKQIEMLDNMLAVGHEEHFYLYNLNSNQLTFKYKASGYFGHLYVNDHIFYVADASGIVAIDKEGNIVWANDDLAMDGVIVSEFDDDKIYGSAELDPPGGWEDFKLDLHTGKKI